MIVRTFNLNNESGQLYGFAVHVNMDRSSGKRVFCKGFCEERSGTDFDLLYRQFGKLNGRKRNFLLYLVLFDELLPCLSRRHNSNADLSHFKQRYHFYDPEDGL